MAITLSEFKNDLEELCDLLNQCSVKNPLPGFLFNDEQFSQLSYVTNQLMLYFFDDETNSSSLFSSYSPIDLMQRFMDYSNPRVWLKPQRYIAFILSFESSSIGIFLTSIYNNSEVFSFSVDSNLGLKLNRLFNYFGLKTSPTSISSSDGGSCYIATLVFNSYDSKQVVVLRKFRDNILLPSKFGKNFVAYYYSVGPSIIAYLKDKKIINILIRFSLGIFIFVLKFTNRLIGKNNDY